MPKSDRAAGPSGAAPGPANPHPPARRVWLARAALAPWGAAATLASARTGASAAPAAPVAPTTARAPQGDAADGATAAARAALAPLVAHVEREAPDVLSLLALQHGQPVLRYFRAGTAEASLQPVQSVTKSVLSLLFGQALADGRIRRVDGLVAEKLPELLRLGTDARVQRLRFSHLLTMTAGWPADQTARRDRDDDLLQLARRPFVSAPGTRFAYDNGAANLLALALERAVGERLADYAHRRLLAPLGIQRFDWQQGRQGHALGAIGLRLALADMARLGELVRLQGVWAGRALLPADYLRAATTRQNTGGPPVDAGYGYLWWVAPTRRAGAPPTLMASGYGGQWIWIDPALHLVVAATSRRTPDSMARNQAATVIRARIVPALRRLG